MGKKFLKISLVLWIFISYLCPQVKAQEDLTISNWMVEANLVKTGDLHIVEDITFEFHENFNGVFREIALDKTSGISDISVKEIKGDSSVQYTLVENAQEGDQGVYLLKKDPERTTIQIFSPSENQKRTFRISYVVKNVATKYSDIGELYYQFLGKENETPIDHFIVNIQFPQEDIKNQVKIFAHGPLNGQVLKRTNTIYTLSVENVPPDTFIEGRALFPRKWIPLSNRTVHTNQYENILEEERSYRNQILEEAQRKETIKNILKQASLGASILGIFVLIMFMILFRRKIHDFPLKESSKIPEDCTPAVASYLTNTLIGSNTIMATILDLFRKGYLKIEGEEDFIITKVKGVDENLLSHEKHFIHWFIDLMGKGKSVTPKEIEDFSKNNPSIFSNLYSKWQTKIKEDAFSKGYYDKTKGKYGVFFLIDFLILLLLGIFTIAYGSLLGLFSIGISILLLLYGISLFSRRSDYGYEQYKQWMKFKKYRKEFQKDSSIEDLSQQPLDPSLIYALSLGVDEPIRNFDVHRMNPSNRMYYTNGWIFWYFLFRSQENNALERSIHNSFEGSGTSFSGGGFTGGGGGGAGGGGAGGF